MALMTLYSRRFMPDISTIGKARKRSRSRTRLLRRLMNCGRLLLARRASAACSASTAACTSSQLQLLRGQQNPLLDLGQRLLVPVARQILVKILKHCLLAL